MTRERAYKTDPETARITDFVTQHGRKLRAVYHKYIIDTGEAASFLEFSLFMYYNGQDLVINPSNN